MFNTKWAIQKFIWLSHQEKVVKLKSVVTVVQNALPMYWDIAIQLSTLGDKTTEDTLDMYYTMIMKNIENLQGDSLETFKEDLKLFKQSLQKEIWNKMDKQELEDIEKTLQDFNI
jgi:hypothetical protein